MAEGVIKNTVHHFRGRSEHVLDEKGRLNIATRFRDVLRCQYDERVMVTPWNNFIKAYPVSEWEALEITLRHQGKKHPHLKQMMRYMIGGVVECSLDKQGRILLPQNLRIECGINKEIIANGMISYFEIWDKETWEKSKPSADMFVDFDRALTDLELF